MKTTVKTILATLLVGAFALPALAERGDDANRASKNGRTEGSIGGVSITLEYGRPNVRGREVWGALVPWGKVWRTGADEATTISFSADVTVEGQALPAGTYGLFTIPGETEWVVIFNRVAEQWGAFGYDESQDGLRVKVTPRAAEHVEALEFEIEGSQVVLRWAAVAVPFSVAAGG